MDDARFNSTQGSSAGGDTGFDYFGAPPTGAAGGTSSFGPPAGQPFTAPPATAFGAPPQSQFGGPVAYGAPPVQSPSRKSISGRPKTSVIIVAILVLLGGFRLWNMHQHGRAITLPTTFNGQSPTTDFAGQQLKDGLVQQLRSDNPGIGVNAQIYGESKEFTILGAARGHLDVQKDLVDPNSTAPTTFGNSMCTTALDQSYVACERSGSSLTVFVFAKNTTPAVVAALVDSAYGQF
jgi:hypothetical protein